MPKQYGDWVIDESLSEGGQGHTFLVRRATGDPEETCVLKRLKDKERIGRFRNEVEAGLKLEHQNIVKVVDYDLGSDQPYIVTKHYRGGSLDRNRPFASRNAGQLLDLFGQICDGLEHAHSTGFVHRDLKPGNVFLEEGPEGHAVVGDFGLCFIDNGERVTLSEEGAVGSRFFTAPELEGGRARATAPTALSDVYSLGKVLYWLLSSGETLSREEHREAQSNLVELTNNLFMEHANRLLDHMVAEDPAYRWNLAQVRQWLPNLKRVVVGEYNPVGPSARTRCNHCGIGAYVFVGRDRASLERDSFITAGGHPDDMRVLVCHYCGHVQTFRPDIARRNSPSDSTPWDTSG